jgi:hypothetical protein
MPLVRIHCNQAAHDSYRSCFSLTKLHRPKLQYLFIGCDHNVPFYRLQDIQKYYYNHGIVVEKLDLADAMGTFNILNAEDRDVAVALVRNTNEAEYEIEWLKEQEESISK